MGPALHDPCLICGRSWTDIKPIAAPPEWLKQRRLCYECVPVCELDVMSLFDTHPDHLDACRVAFRLDGSNGVRALLFRRWREVP